MLTQVNNVFKEILKTNSMCCSVYIQFRLPYVFLSLVHESRELTLKKIGLMSCKVLNIKQLFIHIYWTVLIKASKATLTVENYFHQVLKTEF